MKGPDKKMDGPRGEGGGGCIVDSSSRIYCIILRSNISVMRENTCTLATRPSGQRCAGAMVENGQVEWVSMAHSTDSRRPSEVEASEIATGTGVRHQPTNCRHVQPDHEMVRVVLTVSSSR